MTTTQTKPEYHRPSSFRAFLAMATRAQEAVDPSDNRAIDGERHGPGAELRARDPNAQSGTGADSAGDRRRSKPTPGSAQEGQPSDCAPRVDQASGAAIQRTLCDRVRQRIGRLGLSAATGDAYVYWIDRFLRAHRLRKPTQLRASHIADFLRELSADPKIPVALQHQALSALLFLYREALDLQVRWIDCAQRAESTPCAPTQDCSEQLLWSAALEFY